MGDLNQQLKSGFLFDQMKDYLASDAGKESAKKVGFVYQFNIAPKKLGLDEVIYIVDLIKCEVIKGDLCTHQLKGWRPGNRKRLLGVEGDQNRHG
ncbi:sterol carrier protein 2-like isoform X2 [Silene latifolia]|uniref:sterol carrier protein 2-like isoform X2 n=1 Tax=Silene latifolia TaxID=37657 RepID=UPI003D77B63F